MSQHDEQTKSHAGDRGFLKNPADSDNRIQGERAQDDQLAKVAGDRFTLRAYDNQERKLAVMRDRLSYHPPSPDQLPRYQALRDAAMVMATVMIRNCPMSSETDYALGMLENTLMQANKSIALRGY